MTKQITGDIKAVRPSREELHAAQNQTSQRSSMAGLTLYLDLVSQPCRSVYIFAKVNNIPFHNEELDLFKDEHLSEEFRKINVIHKLPTLKDGAFAIGESTAILRYLANKYKTPDHWYPSDIQKRALVDEYLAWQLANTRPHGSMLYISMVIGPFVLGQEIEPQKLEPLKDDFNATLKSLEEKFLQGKPFIAGEDISIADLVAIEELMQPVPGGVVFYEDRPVLAAWKERVEKAIGEDLFREAHQKLLHDSKLQHLSQGRRQGFKNMSQKIQ